MTKIVKFETTLGDFEVELYYEHAPKCCENFYQLAKRGYYNNCKFHRIIPNFIAQTGDPTGTGKGGTSIYGPRFEDEISENLNHVGAGILSMANSGPNTNASQFFITLAPCQKLDGTCSIFGRIFSNIHIVNKLSLIQTDSEDKPLENVYIIKAYPVE